MGNAIAKPKFEEVVAVTTMNLPDVGLKFNAQRVGPMNFAGLRTADYGPDFRMPTMPELVPLVYASLENKDYETAKKVIKTLRENWLTGNTAFHYFPIGMFAEDSPKMKSGRIVLPNQKTLEKRLGSHEEKGVVFSDDRSLRFVPYGFKMESQTALNLSTNPGVIALAGSEQNAEMLAKASQNYRENPHFWALSSVKTPQTRVAGLGSDVFGDRLVVGADGSENYDYRFSFGVLNDTNGVAPKNK